MNKVSFFLRFGIAFSFLYAAVSSFLNPNAWIGFFPIFLKDLIPNDILLILFSIFEIILALWLISNKAIFYASILASFTLLGIIIFNFSSFDIVFRDVTILFAAIALAFLSK
ncbi:MAG: hypothetical protein AABX61_00545 [Nanoarchaeota archaeon]